MMRLLNCTVTSTRLGGGGANKELQEIKKYIFCEHHTLILLSKQILKYAKDLAKISDIHIRICHFH